MHWKISSQAIVRSHLTRENKLFRSTIRARRSRRRRRRRRIEEEVREKGEMDSEQKRDKKRGG